MGLTHTHTQTWATSQSTIALSSGEAELYAMTKVAVQMKGMMSLAADLEIGLKEIVRSDSAAAIGIAYRKGIGGRCRHINVQYLFIQERVQEGHLRLAKVLGKKNPADMMTKAVGSGTMQQHFEVHEFQERCWESRKGFEPLKFRDDIDLNISVVGVCRNSRFCVGRR